MTGTPASSTRSRRRAALEIVACSLLVTIAAAIIAAICTVAFDLRWPVCFVIARWLFVAALLLTPIIHQAVVRLGGSWRLPWAFQTPATALLLTAESIGFDILSARLG